MKLEQLPPEILSSILSHLPLQELLPVTLLSRSLRSISAHPSYTPFSIALDATLASSSPYPAVLSKLAGFTHVPPRCFLDVLVRADTKWILERMEVPRLVESEWQEVCDRRFLRSWKRYKENERDTWRATYFRIIRRLQHRTLGCTHEEAWTRFMILHRNGTASVNRIYSRGFDPLEIYREIKQQNNFAAQPTQIRLVLQLQDVRIIAIGVLFTPQSLFINANAHRLLHPPALDRLTDTSGLNMGLRRIVSDVSGTHYTVDRSQTMTGKGKAPVRRRSESATAVLLFDGNTAGTSTGGPLMNGPYSVSRDRVVAAPTGQRADRASIRPGRDSDPSVQTTRPRERSPPIRPFLTGGIGGGGRTIALASNLARTFRIGTNPGTSNAPHDAASGATSRARAATTGGSNWITDGGEATFTTGRNNFGRQGRMSRMMRTTSRDRPGISGSSLAASADVASAHGTPAPIREEPLALPAGPLGSEAVLDGQVGPILYTYSSNFTDHRSQPYPRMTHPQPAVSHRFYPNFTPPPLDMADGFTTFDARATHPTTTVERTRMSFAKTEVGEEGTARWADAEVEMEPDAGDIGGERSWVGPMLIFAQLNPPQPRSGQPSALDEATMRTDGPSHIVHLGPPGMYCSFDWDDLDDIAPWLEIKEDQMGNAARGAADLYFVPQDGNAPTVGSVVGMGDNPDPVARRGRVGMGF